MISIDKNVFFKLGAIGICAFGIYKLTKYLVETQQRIAEEEAEERRLKAEQEAEEKRQKEEERKAQAERVRIYKNEILSVVNYADITKKTLDNDKIAPDDRTYLYDVYKKKYDAILLASSIEGVDKAKASFDEFTKVWLTDHGDKTAEIVSSFVQMDKQKKLDEEKAKEKAAEEEKERKKREAESAEEKKRREAEAAEARKNREAEIEKYKLITNVITKGINTLSSRAESWG